MMWYLAAGVVVAAPLLLGPAVCRRGTRRGRAEARDIAETLRFFAAVRDAS